MGPPRRAKAPPAGFTLLELMIALVMFAVGTLAAMEVFHRTQAGADDGEYVLLATNLAQQCAEALRNVAYASLIVGSSVMSSVSGCGSSVSGMPSGSRSVTISQPYTNLKQVRVTVTWTPPGSGANTTNVALQSYRAGV